VLELPLGTLAERFEAAMRAKFAAVRPDRAPLAALLNLRHEFGVLNPQTERIRDRVSYGAIVPFALSASHSAFASIRMEPVFMVTSQPAATATCLAIEGGAAVQEVDYDALREKLVAAGQVLEWPPTSAGADEP
jgi:hypothetical protein